MLDSSTDSVESGTSLQRAVDGSNVGTANVMGKLCRWDMYFDPLTYSLL